MKIKIDNEFKDLITPLKPEEYQGLRNSLIKEGCRDSIILWGEIIIDGHNRYEICNELNITFNTKQIELSDKEAVKDWIDKNQLARRNLTPDQMSLLRGRIYNRTKRQDGGHGNQKSGDQIDTPKTADKLSADFGISPATIKRDGQIATYLAARPEEEKQVISGEKKLSTIRQEQKQEKLIEAQKQHTKEYEQGNKKPLLYVEDYKVFLDRIKDKSIDLLITDPPYFTEENINYNFVEEWLSLVLPKIKDNGRAYIFIGAYPKEINTYLNLLLSNERFELDNPLIWTYRNTLGQTPKMKYNLNYQMCLHLYNDKSNQLDTSITNEMFSVQDINAPDGRLGDRFFKWQKPDILAKRLIRHSTKEHDKIIDIFAGSGTFLLAANKMGRNSIGCELDKEVAKIAESRGCNVK